MYVYGYYRLTKPKNYVIFTQFLSSFIVDFGFEDVNYRPFPSEPSFKTFGETQLKCNVVKETVIEAVLDVATTTDTVVLFLTFKCRVLTLTEVFY